MEAIIAILILLGVCIFIKARYTMAWFIEHQPYVKSE